MPFPTTGLAPLPLGGARERRSEFEFDGLLNFQNRAVLHSRGVDFSNGVKFEVRPEDFVDLKLLGVGTYGQVRAVQHTPTRAMMARKRIPVTDTDVGLKQIYNELAVLNGAESPFIVSFYGAYFHDSFVFYCIELMDAGSLDKLIPATGMPESVVGYILFSVVSGLLYLKQNLNVIHRDVRPSNILVNSRGAIKLCDFGVSGHLEKSLAHSFTGCLQYMAPERITSKHGAAYEYGVQSDIWSLGLTAFEITTGRFPFVPTPNVFEHLQRVVNEPSPALTRGVYADELCDLVDTCLQKECADRKDYAHLLQHPFIVRYSSTDISTWVQETAQNLTLPSQSP